jgi:hypothetical protein
VVTRNIISNVVTDEPVEFEKQPVEVEDFRESDQFFLEEFIEHTPV